ncbi:hypothetical protein E4T52_01638 [Aureobasidium sp. EXF-3400]|nr:hypothetical protein E4T52_01638 [Aureobasidium sp. EXF-3400]
MDYFKSDIGRQARLAEWFPHTPTAFFSETCIEHNGFFGCHTSSKNAAPSHKPSPASSSITQTELPSPSGSATGHQEIVSTYFRLIVKILEAPEAHGQPPISNAPSQKDYKWHEMGFVSFSSDSRSTMLCFDVPPEVIQDLQTTLYPSTEQLGGPFGLHIPLLEELVKLYDRSVWAMAKKVREIEKKKLQQRLAESGRRRSSTTSSLPSTLPSLPNDSAKPKGLARTAEDFEYLFEISRHIAHSVETTQIATEVVERMKIACESLNLAHWNTILTMRAQKLNFLQSMFRGLSARSISNEKRLTSEQVLVSNGISWMEAGLRAKVNKDMSFFSSEIALATRADGAAMKTIALVTLTFLPATFVTALLGMNFFTVDSDPQGGHLTSTKDLWIYFVIAVPLTTAVLCFWWWWQNKEEEKAKHRNEMGLLKDVEKAEIGQ